MHWRLSLTVASLATLSMCSSAPEILAAQAGPGQEIFSNVCASCHGLDGRGGEHAPNIVSVAKVQLESDSELARVVGHGIPSQGMPAFAKTLDAVQLWSVVGYLRKLQGKDDSLSVRGDALAGKTLFFGKAKCADCHGMNGQGGFFASDLSRFGLTHSPREIREAVVDPYKNLDPRHETIAVTTLQGKTFTGMARNEDNFSLQLQTLDGDFHFFEKSNLLRVERQRRSFMPDNYGSTLSSKQIDGLVAYLVSPTH